MQRETEELVGVLRSTLEDVQDSIWNAPPAVEEMKQSVLRVIAELQAELHHGPSAHL
jgi:hypothetical protein